MNTSREIIGRKNKVSAKEKKSYAAGISRFTSGGQAICMAIGKSKNQHDT